jgi:hypothetical protein
VVSFFNREFNVYLSLATKRKINARIDELNKKRKEP